MYWMQWSRSAGLASGPVLSMMRTPGLLGLDHDALDLPEPLAHARMQRHRRLHRGLRVELGRVGDLEEHVLHDVAAEGLRQQQRLALEEHVLETPGLGAERRRVAHLAGERDEREAYRAAGGIARRPALARAGVGRVPIGAQRPAVDPGVGDRVHHLLERAREHAGDDGRGGDAHQQHVIEAHAVEAVLEREHALDLVRLDHRGEQRRARWAARAPASPRRARGSRPPRGWRRGCRTDGPTRQPARCR